MQQSPARFKALLWGRRTGKTDLEKRDLAHGLLSVPESENLFIGLTSDTAARNLWRPLERLDRELGLGLKFDASKMRVRSFNDAILQVAGSETVRDLEKPRGGGYRRVCVDECGAMRPSYLEYLVTDVLEPAMMDDPLSSLWLSGTPGTTPVGFWHDATTGKLPGWEVSHATAAQNPHVDFNAFVYDPINGLLKRRGWDETHPKFQREYLARWVVDPTNLVYRFDRARNVVDKLPPLLKRSDRWRTVIALDFGVDNATALVVLKYSERYGQWVFVVHAWRRVGLAPSDAADLIAQSIAEYDPDVVVGDTGGIGLAFVRELNKRYPKLSIQAAKKAEKRTRLEIMSDALGAANVLQRRGLFIVAGNGTEDLTKELATLEWNEARTDIADGQDDDLANALQYGYGEVPAFENADEAPPDVEPDIERATRGDDDEPPERPYYEETDL